MNGRFVPNGEMSGSYHQSTTFTAKAKRIAVIIIHRNGARPSRIARVGSEAKALQAFPRFSHTLSRGSGLSTLLHNQKTRRRIANRMIRLKVLVNGRWFIMEA